MVDKKNFIKVETAKKTQEQIDRENAERDKKLKAQKMKQQIFTLAVVIGISLLIGYFLAKI